MRQWSRRHLLYAGIVSAGVGMAGCNFDNRSVSGGHLFAVNRDDSTQQLTIVVTRVSGEDVAPIISATYEIPSQTALQFESILAAEETFLIWMSQPDTNQDESIEITTQQCESSDESETVDVSIKIEDRGAISIVSWRCDDEYILTEDVSYVDPEEHRIASVTETGT